MREFRSGSSRVLITTDLLARGIDVQQVGAAEGLAAKSCGLWGWGEGNRRGCWRRSSNVLLGLVLGC